MRTFPPRNCGNRRCHNKGKRDASPQPRAAAANARALDPGWDYRPEQMIRSRCSLESIGGKMFPTTCEVQQHAASRHFRAICFGWITFLTHSIPFCSARGLQ
ncbi:MAG: hypothetical protein LBQ54_01645 [Planctomycetaceae bacterium]|nr:hypothetical protein [Planctomycetaceae bacterium]